MANWPFTNKMRQMCMFDGDGDAIWTQGNEIWNLGWDMTYASQTLEHLASGEDGQQGKAVDALRKKVDDAYVTLELAGELYRPLGLALRGYGAEVRDGIKTQVDTCYNDAFEKWNTYIDLPGDKDGTDYFLGINKPEEGSAEEAEQEAEDAAKLKAWEEWEAAANAYDTAYDSWEDAWDEATKKIDDAFTDDLKDSKWEDVKGWIKVALEVLKWAGLVVGIAALIIGGPIIAAIAAAIAVATIILTVVMAIDGDGSWTDVAWAAVDLIPFGKAGKLFKHSDGFKTAAKEFAGEGLKNFKMLKFNGSFNPLKWRPNGVYGEGWDAVKAFKGNKGWARWGDGANTSWSDSITKVLTGKNFKDWGDTANGMPGSIYEMYHSKVGHWLKIEGWGNTIYNQWGNDGEDRTSLRNSNPIVKTIW